MRRDAAKHRWPNENTSQDLADHSSLPQLARKPPTGDAYEQYNGDLKNKKAQGMLGGMTFY
jgi:hypothetical protein